MAQNYFSGIDPKWQIQLIQGFVGSFDCKIAGQNLSLYLISRRSQYRGGTRYNHRGADTDGNTSNFVETEQLVVYKEKVTSYIIIRGSVPLLWEQKGMDQKLRMHQGQEISSQAFKKHYQAMKDTYKQIISVNLMKRTDTQEKILTDAYENELKAQNIDQFNLTYDYFDFNSNKNQLNTVTDKYRANDSLTSLYGHLTVLPQQNYTQTKNQQGVFRINCKDCLDRTNTYMMKIALTNLEYVLKVDHGVDLEQEVEGNPLYKMDQPSPHPLLKQFKYMWAESGDNISVLYAGTDAATTRLTKKGYEGFSNQMKHKMICANVGFKRLIQSKFQDAHKQECLNLIAGIHTKSTMELPFDIREQLMKESTFYKKKALQIYSVSLNVQCTPTVHEETVLPEFFNFGTQNLPDLVVVGLQEITEYKMFQMHNPQATKLWKNIIEFNLNKADEGGKNYDLVDSKDMFGNLILIYAKKTIVSSISDIYHDCVKYGYLDNLAEYGCSAVHFKYCDANLCFINAYLPSGRKKQDKRIEAIKYIHRKCFQKKGVGKYKKMKIDDNDFVLFFGDFNFRVDMDFTKVKNIIEKSTDQSRLQDINTLLKNDELELAIKKQRKYISNYSEAKLEFFPSYNDSSKKQRPASWRTRVLFQNQGKELISIDPVTTIYQSIKNPNYKRNISTDHIPVYCKMDLKVNQIDQEKSAEVLEKLMRDRNLIGDTIQEVEDEEEFINNQDEQIKQQYNQEENQVGYSEQSYINNEQQEEIKSQQVNPEDMKMYENNHIQITPQ